MASRQKEREELGLDDELEDDEDHVQPVDKMDWKVFSLIIGGALGDNVGSSGLMPLCLSPLAFERFYAFAPDPSNPIMSQVAYKWISVLVALMVVPGTLVSPFIYNKFGLAGGCIIGNVITGIVSSCQSIRLLVLSLCSITHDVLPSGHNYVVVHCSCSSVNCNIWNLCGITLCLLSVHCHQPAVHWTYAGGNVTSRKKRPSSRSKHHSNEFRSSSLTLHLGNHQRYGWHSSRYLDLYCYILHCSIW